MSTIINASTTSGAVITPDTSGTLVFQSNGTTIMTVGPTGVSTQVGAPAFSAYQSSAQTINTNTFTKLTLNTKNFDTNSNFDNTTNYRFTPTVAGYYQVNLILNMQAAVGAGGVVIGAIYKNGTNYRYVFEVLNTNLSGFVLSGSDLIQMNGTTDYLEFYVFQSQGSSQLTAGGVTGTTASASMVRSA